MSSAKDYKWVAKSTKCSAKVYKWVAKSTKCSAKGYKWVAESTKGSAKGIKWIAKGWKWISNAFYKVKFLINKRLISNVQNFCLSEK